MTNKNASQCYCCTVGGPVSHASADPENKMQNSVRNSLGLSLVLDESAERQNKDQFAILSTILQKIHQ